MTNNLMGAADGSDQAFEVLNSFVLGAPKVIANALVQAGELGLSALKEVNNSIAGASSSNSGAVTTTLGLLTAVPLFYTGQQTLRSGISKIQNFVSYEEKGKHVNLKFKPESLGEGVGETLFGGALLVAGGAVSLGSVAKYLDEKTLLGSLGSSVAQVASNITSLLHLDSNPSVAASAAFAVSSFLGAAYIASTIEGKTPLTVELKTASGKMRTRVFNRARNPNQDTYKAVAAAALAALGLVETYLAASVFLPVK